jgi:dihydrolipoamide dehydrogenase
MNDSFDLVVVGAGPGGYVAAIRATQLGMNTAIVERTHLGGICLNWGCIPTKALLKSGEMFESLSQLSEHGLLTGEPTFNLENVIKRSRKTVLKLNTGVAFLMKKNKIHVIEGSASLERADDAPRVDITLTNGDVRSLSAKNVILATGARPRVFPSLGMVPVENKIWTYREAMVPTFLPSSIIVIGAGAIGIEFASFYRALGCNVTVVEAADRILPNEDVEISSAAKNAFQRRGIAFRLDAKVISLNTSNEGVMANIASGGNAETLNAQVAIVAIGVQGNVEDMGLEGLGLEIENGAVRTDKFGKTNIAGLYAIGDVAGPPWLAHKASHDGIKCVEHLMGINAKQIHSPIPGCTYSQPQIASVGLTEAQANQAGHKIKIGIYFFRNLGKAIASGETEGFVKTIFDAETGQLLGAHLIGSDVTEMISSFVIAMSMQATASDLMGMVFPHPTFSEAIHESVLSAYGLALHM